MLFVDVQLLSPDLRNLMHFDRINGNDQSKDFFKFFFISVKNLVINLSHPYLLPHKLQQYLPQICADLSRNSSLHSVSLVLLYPSSSSAKGLYSANDYMKWCNSLRTSSNISIHIYFTTEPLNNAFEISKKVKKITI